VAFIRQSGLGLIVEGGAVIQTNATASLQFLSCLLGHRSI